MKELSIEEKAKRYDEAMKAAVVAHKDEDRHLKATLERIFPELEESEDEKIRKELVQFFEEKDEEDFEEWIPKAKVLAWLEKQGEQKPQGKSALEAINEEKVDNANKVEPRQEKLTKFEKAVKQVMEEAIECGDTHNLKADADMLLSLVHKSAWSEEDENMLKMVIESCEQCGNGYAYYWLKHLKDRVQPQNTWKPSDEQVKAVKEAACYSSVFSEKTIDNLISLSKDLKKLREE